jgi:hypothetical protein
LTDITKGYVWKVLDRKGRLKEPESIWYDGADGDGVRSIYLNPRVWSGGNVGAYSSKEIAEAALAQYQSINKSRYDKQYVLVAIYQ